MNEDENNKKKKDDPIAKAFGINPLDGKLLSDGNVIINDPTDDFNYSRENIIDLIEKGNQYLQEFGQIAVSAQSPRHFEVLTNMLNSLIVANEKLLDLKKKDLEIKLKTGESGTTTTNGDIINNNLFVGTTNELQTFIENMNKKNE